MNFKLQKERPCIILGMPSTLSDFFNRPQIVILNKLINFFSEGGFCIILSLLTTCKKKKQRKRRRSWLTKALESHNHQKIPLLFQEGYNYLKITTGEAALHKLTNLSPHYKASLYKAIYHTSISGEPLTAIQSKNHKKEK